MLENYFKPTPANLLRVSFGLKSLIGTISTAAYFEGNKDAAFWFLVAGAIIDFFINCFTEKPKTTTVIIIAVASMFLFSSCNTVHHQKEVRVLKIDSSAVVSTTSGELKKDNNAVHEVSFTGKQKTFSFTFVGDTAKAIKQIKIKDSAGETSIDLGGLVPSSFNYSAHDTTHTAKDSTHVNKDSLYKNESSTIDKKQDVKDVHTDKQSSRFNFWWVLIVVAGATLAAIVLFKAKR